MNSEDGSSFQAGSIFRFQNLSFLGWNSSVTRISVNRPWDKRVKLTVFMDDGIGLCVSLKEPLETGIEKQLLYSANLTQIPRKKVNFHLQAGNSFVWLTTSGVEVEQQKSKGLEPRSDEGMSQRLVAILMSTMSTWHIFHRIFWNSSDGFFHIPSSTKRKKRMKGQIFRRNQQQYSQSHSKPWKLCSDIHCFCCQAWLYAAQNRKGKHAIIKWSSQTRRYIDFKKDRFREWTCNRLSNQGPGCCGWIESIEWLISGFLE